MAFPTTSILDTGVADDGDLSAAWTNDITGQGYALPEYASNQIRSNTGNAFSSAYWDLSTFGPDSEVYCQVPVLPGNAIRLYLGVLNPATAGMDGYEVEIDTSNLYIHRVDNQSRTLLDNHGSHGLTAGDWIGLSRSGVADLTAYVSDDGATFSTFGTSFDNTYTTAGVIGLLFQNDATARITNFGGGTTVSLAPAPVIAPDYSLFPKSKLRR